MNSKISFLYRSEHSNIEKNEKSNSSFKTLFDDQLYEATNDDLDIEKDKKIGYVES